MAENLYIELADCENVLLREIAMPEMKRNDIAQTYALALASSESRTMDWSKVNEAIIARWSFSALTYIKERAWKLVNNGGKLPEKKGKTQ